MTRGNALAVRDNNGLLPQQRIVLQELLSARSWGEIQSKMGLSSRQLARWLREDAAFRKAYDSLFSQEAEVVRRQIEGSAGRAADALDSALDATKDAELKVTCPECEHEFVITAETPDWGNRMRAAETVLKVSKVLKDVKKIEGEIIHMSLPERLALAAIKAGRTEMVPAHIIEALRGKGALDSDTQDDSLPATFRVLEEEDNAASTVDQ